MCGIAGIVYRDREHPVAESLVRQMCSALQHRGPDDEGRYVCGAVGLGMRRLSIIDLNGGRQPIFNEDGSKVIVFNGEIYNYRDLRHGLLHRGHTFRSAGDTETVLHLYEEQGVDCVNQLRGMFACAIWDASSETLLLARDRFGIKPLYFVTAPWGIAFASELKALLAAGLTSRELDWEALDAYVQLGYVPAPASPFRDIRKLEPGHWLRWRRTGEFTVQSYWDLPRGAVSAPPDIERQVVEWIDASVAAHLVSDVPIAAFLSGGLDSSAVVTSVASVAARQREGVPHAFTARYHGSGAGSTDETDLARRLAKRYERLPRALRAAAAAIGDLLPGAGGSARELALDRVKRFLHAGNGGASGAGGGGMARGTPERYLGLVSRAPDSLRQRLYDPALRNTISGNAALERFTRLHRAASSPEGLPAALYLDYKTYLADDILALSDRLSMAHSLEIRVPLVDHVLAEQVFPLPAHFKVRSWQLKPLLKRALASRIPAAHFKAPKRGFVGPTAAWLRHELRPMVLDELSPARMARLGYFDPSMVQRLLDDHFSQRHNRETILWALLCFSTWHRLFAEAPAARRVT